VTAGEASPAVTTFLFTDIEGSTRLVAELGDQRYATLLTRESELVRDAVTTHGGHVFGSEGDAHFAVFDDPAAAVAAAAAAQRALAAEPWPGPPVRVRMAIHSGPAQPMGDDYVGLALHQISRILPAGHGGQVLVSDAARGLLVAARWMDSATGLALRDMGEHRLKDLAGPERIHQLVGDGLDERFPPLRTLDASPHNLPSQLTTFVGRAEIGDVDRLLDEARLVTLTGPGGTGKTRLSLEIAHARVGRHPGGVWFVAVASIRDPDLLPSAIASAVGLVAAGRPPLERVTDHFRDRDALIVLDNLEQVLAGAPMVAQLLASAPALRILATSRAPLRVAGEREFPVPPLDLPPRDEGEPGALMRYASVRLFVERAVAVRPSFALTTDNAAAVARIVRRVDGLPLAIELAAARTRLLPPAALAERLDDRLGILVGGERDRPDRQRTLRGAIEWSYELLDEPARRAFARLGVFVGAPPFELGLDVVRTDGEREADTLDSVTSLVEHSLARSLEDGLGEPRLGLLETIREYALERLQLSGELELLRDRHAEAFQALADRYAAGLSGRDRRRWLDRFELDHDDLRAALAWRIEQRDCEPAARMLSAVWRFWQARGHVEEGLARAREVLALPGFSAAALPVRLQALDAAGGLAYWADDMAAARELYAAQLELARSSGDARLIADALVNLSAAAIPVTDAATWRTAPGASGRLADEAVGLYRSIGDADGEARALWSMSDAAFSAGDSAVAEELQSAALPVFERTGDDFWVSWTAFMRGLARHALGNQRGTLDDLRLALERFRGADDVSGLALVAAALASMLDDLGEDVTAHRLAGLAEGIAARTGMGLVTRAPSSATHLVTRDPSSPELDRAWEEGRAMDREEGFAFAIDAADRLIAALPSGAR